MRIVLRKSAHASESMQHTALFEPVNRAPFRQPHRQFAIRSNPISKNVAMERTVHRLQVVLLFVDFDRRIHILGVEPKMAAGFPESRASDMRRIDKVVSGFEMLLLAVVLRNMANQSAFGMP